MRFLTHSAPRALGALAIAATAGLLGGCGTSGSSSASAAPPASAPAPAPAPAGTPPASSPHGGSLAGKVIVLDPGHNGGNAKHPEIINRRVNILTGYKACNTTGTTTDDGYPEHAFNWDVANRLAKDLRAKGAKVILTRDSDNGVGPCIDERAKIANRAHANASLSIHADGAPAEGHGFHVIEPAVIKGHNEQVVPRSRTFGLDVRDAFHQGTGIPYATYVGTNGLNIRKDLGGLNLAKVPAVLIESGNMRNPGDAAKMKSPSGRQRMADALSEGLAKFLS